MKLPTWGSAIRACAGLVLGVIVRLWLATLRVDVRMDPSLHDLGGRPWVLSFFHGTQWPLLAWHRRRPTVVLVSLSLDGVIQSRALRVLGLDVVRGSSSRGGARGLAALVRVLRAGGADAAFAVDGPRGPYGVAKGGARLAARSVDGVLVPMGAACARATVLMRAWDRFGIAWPFSRVVVVLGQPIEPIHCDVEVDASLGSAIASANASAREHLNARRASASLLGPVADPDMHPAGAPDRTK